MIFDVARHKFSEGLLTLMLFALMAMIVALSAGDIVPVEGGAPLRGFVDMLSVNHPVATALALLPLVVYSGLRFARAAVRVGVYSASSLAPIALGGVTMFAVLGSANYLYIMVVAALVSEVLGRLLYCFGANMRMSYLFTSMLSLGAMPLVDSALIPFVIVLAAVVIVVRGTLREGIITIAGVAVPTFVYCYTVWLLGGQFNIAFADVWNADVSTVQYAAVLSYLTVPRLVFIGVTLFLTICSVLVYYNTRVTLLDSARTIWRLLIMLLLMLVAILLLMPSATPAVVVVLMLVMTLMLPQFFIRVDVYVATIAYLIWVVSAVATLF